MELRNAEKKIDSVKSMYEDLARRRQPSHHVTPWHELVALRGNEKAIENEVKNDDEVDSSSHKELSAQEMLQKMVTIESEINELLPLVSKFRQRLNMKDPISGAPRYGEKTQKRVIALLEVYDVLDLAIEIANGRQNEDTTKHISLVQSLKYKVKSEEDASLAHQQQKEDDIRLKKAVEEKIRILKQEKEKKEQMEEQIRQRREREELAERAEAARIARIENERRLAQEARDSERAYVESIPKGIDGVKQQLKKLRESCKSNKEIDTALGALHTFFSQISSRPEEAKFRRIRRDHPKFLEDVGRHDGGNEVLIAAGFTLEEFDGVKCFFSREPDLANEMDKWSSWFDLIKSTLNAIEEEMTK